MSGLRTGQPVEAPRRRVHPGRIVLGLLLVVLGTGWLVDSLGIADVRWSMLLPAILVVIGAALLATAHRDTSGGLVATGVVVSVLLLLSAVLTFPFTGRLAAVGDVAHRPTSAEEVEEGFALAVGSLEVDLRELPTATEPMTVEAGVGIGELVLLVPADATVEVEGRAAVGEVAVAGLTRSGLGVELRERLDNGDADAVLLLDVSVGIGKVEVRR